MRRILHIWIILLISASGNQAIGQIGQMNRSQNQVQSLNLRVITKIYSICYGEDLSIEMELKNKSKNKIAINSESLWSFITFRAYKPSKFSVNGARVLVLPPPMLSHPKDDFVILKPGEIYKSTKVVSLDDQFFKEESEVEFDVSYQQLEERDIGGISLWIGLTTSNKLKLQIKSCISDEKTTSQRLRIAETTSRVILPIRLKSFITLHLGSTVMHP